MPQFYPIKKPRWSSTKKKLATAAAGFVVKKIAKRARSWMSGKTKWSVKRGLFTRSRKNGRGTSKAVKTRELAPMSGNSAENFLGKKRAYPTWWKTISKSLVPNNYTGRYFGQISAAINEKQSFTHWLHTGTYEIQEVLNNVGVKSSTNAGQNPNKQYMVDFVRSHEWRNSAQSTVEVEFYLLFPRRDLPNFVSDGTTQTQEQQIAPVSTNNESSGGVLVGPNLYIKGITDRGYGPEAPVSYKDLAATPYMAPTLTSNFKIKPLKLAFPNGQRGHRGILEPGQTIKLTVSRTSPMMCSYHKFGLTGGNVSNVCNTYEVLRQTPLIFGFIRGTVSHDTVTTTAVGVGVGRLDYVCTTRWEQYNVAYANSITNKYTSSTPTVNIAEEVIPVTGNITTEATT